MPQLVADVIDLTNDSDPEDAVRRPAQGPRQHRAHPLSAAARDQLYKAIETCPEDKLRDILANMVVDDSVSARSLFENLVVVNPPPLPAVEQPVDLVQPVGRNLFEPAPNMVPRWATCEHCGKDFDFAEEREEDECIYHPGMTRSHRYIGPRVMLLTCPLREQVLSRLITANGRTTTRTCTARWIPQATGERILRVSDGPAARRMARRLAALKGRILNRRSGARDIRAVPK